MKDRKRRMEAFSFFNVSGISRHLEKMAEKGWLLDKITNYCWEYRRIEPRKIHFFISYYPKASAFDPALTEGQQGFIDFCRHTGWKLAATSAQMQIFYNEEEDPVPIETEPELEMEAIHSSAKKSFLPAYCVLLVCAIMQTALFVTNLSTDLIGSLARTSLLLTGFCNLALWAICGTELASYFIWYFRAKKTVPQGLLPVPRDTGALQKGFLAAVIAAFLLWLAGTVLAGDALMKWIAVAMCGYIALLFSAVNGTKEFLKRRKVSRGWNRFATIGMSFVLGFAMMGIIIAVTLRANDSGFFDDRSEETYTYRGMTWTLYKDELPVTVEDLMDVHFDGYVRKRRAEESILLADVYYSQYPRMDAEDKREIPALNYRVVTVKLPLLYDLCRDSLIREREELELTYIAEDPTDWGAKEVYRLCYEGVPCDTQYLICYDRMLVDILFNNEPTAQQKAVFGEKFGK